MTEVLLRSPSSLPPTTTNVSINKTRSHHHIQIPNSLIINNAPNSFSSSSSSTSLVEEEEARRPSSSSSSEADQVSLLALLIATFRKSMVASCRSDISEGGEEGGEEMSSSMEIGWPSNVRHVAHVTFDRFNGFRGLPAEFEHEVHRRAPSASASVFGVSTESMQCSYDSRGNSVPTILLLMQKRLYALGALRIEGIFRINGENSQEEYVREQLNNGVVPEDVDIHCLAGLIKAWFRELPSGILDPLEPEHVMQCQSEEDFMHLVRLLPPTEGALLDWTVNLMADVVQEEHQNKMNAHNVAMVFAPNMTQMVDPLTALMYAVQIMNFLKTLVVKTLKEREDSAAVPFVSHAEPSDENGQHSPSPPYWNASSSRQKEDREHIFFDEDPVVESPQHRGKAIPDRIDSIEDDFYSNCGVPTPTHSSARGYETGNISVPKSSILVNFFDKSAQSSKSNFGQELRKVIEKPVVQGSGPDEKPREISIVSRINPRVERVEAWR
ncbi:hypothetical protein C5167_028796 [Papaver somniferum]|uniref:rho GTPase-activating protein 1-like n=1 Tax=Papaver somniferum TaxID=3469 RepID=UPI000E7014E9|nr:rho GTPase-activating protein 1-like [Papaver somniferum]RZC90957.1 hypothetical protein C5167_028796 [Papaver somniferum]